MHAVNRRSTAPSDCRLSGHTETALALTRLCGFEDAAKYVPLENLCLSPQCGFASEMYGNKVTLDDEKAKLGLVVKVAEEVWGAA